MKKYYFAHPVESRKKLREWELNIEKRAAIDLANPFYDIKRPDIELLDRGVKNWRIWSAKKIVETDIGLIAKARDGLLVLLDENVAVGALQEMVYAKFGRRKVFSVVMCDKFRDHPWIKYHSDKIFKNLVELEKYLLDRRK